VAGALALYHIAPIIRAGSRIAGGDVRLAQEGKGAKGLGGPVLHFIVHSICLLGLGRLLLAS
jgi:hypothetical protein